MEVRGGRVWWKKFAHGRESVGEEEPGSRVVSTTDTMIAAVNRPHVVKLVCDWINFYMNLDDTLKHETLILDV